MRKLAIAATLAALIAAACAWSADPAATTQPAETTARITLLHVNDIHGRTMPYEQGGKSVGGYSRLATLVKRMRAEANDALLIHAGDELSRGDALTRRTLGHANVTLMNRIGFDLWTPGNGEFYDGKDNLIALGREANFPLLTANVKLAHTGKHLGAEFVVRRLGAVKVAFFGLCHFKTALPSAKGLKVSDPIETARALVPELRKKADIVVAVTHIGYWEDLKLAGKVAGIDVIIGGHSHTLLKRGDRVKGPGGGEVLICQAGEYMRHLGRIELILARADGRWRIAQARAEVIPIDAKVPEDQAVKALLARLSAAAPTRPAGYQNGR
ncbi:MAG TPA: bifunctional UDP-sugar hydrolase/5'-nucleotidase [Phycisphaerae bacterium]|nr:bifunctional UDP-sugar hydrolase/5'-nucleotidase [Phycisphaerae bacterium]